MSKPAPRAQTPFLKIVRAVQCLSAFVMFVALFAAAEPTPARAESMTLTADDVAKVVDPLMADWLAHGGTGAVVVVTGPDAPVFAKGYGSADREANHAFTADRTLVRPGSISKLFTAISVMQLVDEGKLNLDRDVSSYVGFTIPTPQNGAPVTLRRLLTHTAGFEDRSKELYSSDPVPTPLGEWLARSLPPRLFPRGDIPAYSNYGFALVGYVVERVSGEAFAEYVEKHILKPLRMDHSTFQQPLPAALAPLMAKGYRGTNQAPRDHFETIVASPAGALSATGDDMGRFLRALMNGGELDGARILSPARLEEMMTPTTPRDQIDAGWIGLAFFGRSYGSVEAIGHGGATQSFYSDLEIFPEQRIGVFASRDGYSDLENAPDLTRALAERLGSPSPVIPVPALSNAARFAGVYESSRRADSTFMRISALLGQSRVTVSADGGLVMSSASWPSLPAKPLKPIGGNALESSGGRRLAAVDGAEPYLATPAIFFQRAPWFLNALWIVPALLASLLLALVTVLAWPSLALWRRWRWCAPNLGVKDRRLRNAVKLLLLVDLIVAGAITGLYLFAMADASRLNRGLDPLLIVLFALAWVGISGAGIAVYVAIDFWRRSVGGAWLRLHQTALAASALMIAYFFWMFRIAGTTLQI
jgi:CubicO group peptidase (beta-lactamase class C family)